MYLCPTARNVILIAKFPCRNFCYLFEQLSCMCCEHDSVFIFIPLIYLLYAHNLYDVGRIVVVFKYISSILRCVIPAVYAEHKVTIYA